MEDAGVVTGADVVTGARPKINYFYLFYFIYYIDTDN